MALPGWAISEEGGTKFSARGNAVSGGIFYNLVATVFQIIGSLVGVILFARLLTAEDFGVYGMILPFVGILIMITDGGTVYHTLRRRSLEDEGLSFAFWYCLGIGAVLTALLWASGPVIAAIMAEDRLVAVALVIGLAVVASAGICQHNALAMRCFRNDLRTWSVVIGVTGSMVIGITLALLGAGYWTLVAVLVSRSALMALALVWLTGWIPARPRWNREEFLDIRRLGLTELGGRVAVEVTRAMDRVLVGILFTTTATGYYALAYMLSLVPLSQLTSPLIFVVLPYLSEEREDKEVFFGIVRMVMRALIYLMLPTGLFLGIYATEILPLIIGADKLPAAEIFPMLVMGAVATVATGFISVAFQAVDRPDLTRRYNIFQIGVMAVALIAAAPFGTPAAIAWGVLGAYILGLLHRFVVVTGYFGRDPLAEAVHLAPVLAAGLGLPLAVLAAMGPLGPWRAEQTEILAAAVPVALFVLLYLGVGWMLFGGDLRRMMIARRQGGAAHAGLAAGE